MSGFLVVPTAAAPAGAPSVLSFTQPIGLPAGLKGLYILDSTFGDQLKNYADAASPLSMIGAPASTGYGYNLSPSGGFETGIEETSDMTIAVIAKPLSTGGAIIAHTGNAASLQPEAASLFIGDGGTGSAVRGGAKDGAGAFRNVAILPVNSGGAADPSAWNLMLASFDAAGIDNIWGRSGTDYPAVITTTGRTLKAGTIRLGASLTTNTLYNGACTVAAAAIWQRKLTAAERSTLTASLRAYLEGAGITTA